MSDKKKMETKNNNSNKYWKYVAIFFFVATVLLQIRQSQYDIMIISGYMHQMDYPYVISNSEVGTVIVSTTVDRPDRDRQQQQQQQRQQHNLRQIFPSTQTATNNNETSSSTVASSPRTFISTSSSLVVPSSSVVMDDTSNKEEKDDEDDVEVVREAGTTTTKNGNKRKEKVVIVDDLIWYTDSDVGHPDEAPIIGWEDEWMIDWKHKQYDANQKIECLKDIDTPYKSEMLCEIPAYVPARIPKPPLSGTTEEKFTDAGIPRVIFISWMTRKLGRYMYTSVMTLLQFNPDYEVVFFTDDDIDHFMCDQYPIGYNNSITQEFSMVKSGAARVDVWRMMMLERYGGVYLDIDMSALKPLPVDNDHDSMFSGIAGFAYKPNKLGGCLEHWSFAVAPHHPLLTQTIQQIQSNLQEWKEFDVGGKYYDDDEYSFTEALTGPGPFQKALHDLLVQVGCAPVKENWHDVLQHPYLHCQKHYKDFTKVFGTNFRMSSILDLNNSITPKILDQEEETGILEHNVDYDNEMYRMGDIDHNFCTTKSFKARTEDFHRRWKHSLKDEVKYGRRR